MLAFVAMATTPLFIPWFYIDAWTIPLPFGRGDISVYPFSIAVVAAITIGYLVALRFALRNGRPLVPTMILAVYLVVFSFPISYLLNGVVYEPARFFAATSNPQDLMSAGLGWSLFGGIAGAILGAWIWKWTTGGSILAVGESFAFGGPFGWTVARVGCFVTHDHPGTRTDFFLAVADFHTGAPPFGPRHDLGLYELLVLAGISVTFAIVGRSPRKPGFFVGLLAVLYAPCRFFLDFLRAPQIEGGDVRYEGLTPAQYGSIVLLVVGVVVFARLRGEDP